MKANRNLNFLALAVLPTVGLSSSTTFLIAALLIVIGLGLVIATMTVKDGVR